MAESEEKNSDRDDTLEQLENEFYHVSRLLEVLKIAVQADIGKAKLSTMEHERLNQNMAVLKNEYQSFLDDNEAVLFSCLTQCNISTTDSNSILQECTGELNMLNEKLKQASIKEEELESKVLELQDRIEDQQRNDELFRSVISIKYTQILSEMSEQLGKMMEKEIDIIEDHAKQFHLSFWQGIKEINYPFPVNTILNMKNPVFALTRTSIN